MKTKKELNENLQLFSEYNIDFTFLSLEDMIELNKRFFNKWKDGRSVIHE